MKIISWNCHFGFDRKKAEYILKYNADIFVIQECTEEDLTKLIDIWKNILWYGDYIDGKYGIGIFSNSFNLKKIENHKTEYRYIVPYKIFNDKTNFTLFSIWTKNVDLNKFKKEYVEQTYYAIKEAAYQELLKSPVLLIGDFNSNNFFDKDYKRKKVPSHNDIIGYLREYNIESCYHKYYNCKDGSEIHPTLLWQNKIDQQFHIDYCFSSLDFEIKNVDIGSLVEWEQTKLSDHCPLIVDLEFKNLSKSL